MGEAVGSKVLKAAKGTGGYNERMMHNHCAKAGRIMTPIRHMIDIPVLMDGVVKLTPWPWLPPSELLAAIIKLDVTKVKPPADYWDLLLRDFPGHPAGLLGSDVQVSDMKYKRKGTNDCSNKYTGSMI